MDTNRNTSITLFVLMGIGFVAVLVYLFVVVLPKESTNTLGSSNLVLDSPIQKWNLRYSESGIVPFCKDGNEWLGIEVAPGSEVFSSSEGTVIGVEDSTITVQVDANINVQYHPITNFVVFRNYRVSRGDSMGKVKEGYLNLRVEDISRGLYECPYDYFNDFAKSILEDMVLGDVGSTNDLRIKMCECDNLDY